MKNAAVVGVTKEVLFRQGKRLANSKILILGIAYKKNSDDQRESPAWQIIRLLLDRGAMVDYSDPYIPWVPRVRCAFKTQSVPITAKNLEKYDCVVLVTDHDGFDYPFIYDQSNAIIDTCNAFRSVKDTGSKITEV